MIEANILQLAAIYVSSKHNSADAIISGGISPTDLVSHPLWWSGPTWLKLLHPEWPRSLIQVKGDHYGFKKNSSYHGNCLYRLSRYSCI